ncbi:MAG TPA: molybdopterin cofactor-binding domain-containing protein [Terriglobia bacterium]|nr:molybdopterin cofactor-binding domain-containing protein [Terriglobia bacterium]
MKRDELSGLDFSDLVEDASLTRRDFLRTVGSGIVILYWVRGTSQLEAQARGRNYPEDFNAYLKIGRDGRVSCFSGKIEMGQGVVTSLAQMLADEIDVSLDSIDMVMGDTLKCPWDMGTFGSMSTRFFGPALRAAGAEARSVLLELAAERLEIALDKLVVENGVVFERNRREKQVTYAQLAAGKAIVRHAKQKPALKTPSEFKVMGKKILRRDALEKVTGKAKYAGDIRLPGMLYARILRPPAHGAILKNVDTSAVGQVEGASVIRDGELIAVLHKNFDHAGSALGKIQVTFDEPEVEVDDETIFEHLMAGSGTGSEVDKGGALEAGNQLAEIVAEQEYLDGYVAHATIETHTALAQVEAGKATVWASTQTPFPIRDQIAEAIGLRPASVRVITPFLGGGFGGKSPGQQAVEAARLAKLCGKPVLVTRTREEEFFFDTFRPAAVVKIKSGASKTGKIVLWDYVVYCAGDRGAKQFYDIPNHRTISCGGPFDDGPSPHPFGVGPWRAPANNTNTFARESQIDIMASKAGIDPVEFRLKNLKDERMMRVLKTAAERFGWSTARSPSGNGFGVACGMDSGTYVAHIAQIEVDRKSGHVRVKRVVCAQDMGLVINPEGARLQMEGAITMGLGYALAEHVHFKGGKIIDTNFDTYEIPRFSWVPKIEAVIVKADDAPPHGGGEPAIICMGAVVANAIYDATGARIVQLPLNPERVRKALAS